MKLFSSVLCIAVIYAISASTALAAVVGPTTTVLDNSGTSGSPALWELDQDITSPVGTVFTIGGNYNHLIINDGFTFTASSGMTVGTTNKTGNLLEIQAGNVVTVIGDLLCGQTTSIAYYSSLNMIKVSGNGARLNVTGNLRIGSGAAWLVTNNTLNISDGAIVVVNSDMTDGGDFWASNHWSYGNSWLELDGGTLAIYGDFTDNFAYGQGLLSSIKVWDDVTETFQRCAYYNSTTWNATSYLDQLTVNYIENADQAAALGISSEFVGFTMVSNIPEPATISFLAIGTLAFIRRFKA